MVGTFGRRLTAGLALTGEPSSDARGRTCGVIGVCSRTNAKRRHDGVRAGLEGERGLAWRASKGWHGGRARIWRATSGRVRVLRT